MNIVFVTTWEQPCGLATYSKSLATALRALGHSVTIVSEMLDDQISPSNGKDEDGFHVIRCWKRKGAPYESPRGFGGQLLRVLKHLRPDVVHFQHEYGIFIRDSDFAKCCRAIGMPVVTWHTVRHDRHPDVSCRSIVHTQEAAAMHHLLASVIPHGVPQTAGEVPGVQAAAREELGLKPHATIGLVQGFLSSSKGILDLLMRLQGVSRYTTEDLQVHFVGRCDEPDLLLQEIDMRGLDDIVHLAPGFLDEEKRDLWFRAADFAILNATVDSYENYPYSASGQLATAVGYGLPVLARNVPIYRSQEGAGVLLYGRKDNADFTSMFAHLATGRGEALRKQSLAVAAERTWDKVAAMHVKFYEGKLP